MMKHTLVLALLSSVPLVVSCGDQTSGDNDIVAEWSLIANDTMALTDPARPAMAYPNSDEFESIDLTLTRDGAICGMFNKGRISTRACGGPAVGIPYFVIPLNSDGLLKLAVVDLYGNHVMDSDLLKDTCVQRKDSCVICSDELGAVTDDTCVAASDPIAENPDNPTDPQDTTDPATPTPAGPCFDQGAHAFAGFINTQLTFMSLPEWTLDPSVLEVPSVDGIDGELGFWLGVYSRRNNGDDGLCTEFANHELKQEHVLNEETYMFGHRIRCGHLANDALVHGCQAMAISPECSAGTELAQFEVGLLAAHQAWTGSFEGGIWAYQAQHASNAGGDCDNPEHDDCPEEQAPPECAGSPLVFSLDDKPVELMSMEDGPRFDLMSYGVPTQTGWVQHGVMLVLDLNSNGKIDGGNELFGEATKLWTGGMASDGFQALAQYDDSMMGGVRNGSIDEQDAVYWMLEVWNDADHDGIASEGELTSAFQAGIKSISISSRGYSPTTPIEPAGNEIGLQSVIELTNGRSTPVYDVWFTYRVMHPDS